MEEAPLKRSQLRLPPELHASLVEAARESGRSMNAEIVARLDASFRRTVDDDQVVEVVERLQKAMDRIKEDATIAKAGAYTSSRMVADLIGRTYGDDPPPELAKLRDASLKVAAVYQAAVDAIEDEDLKPVRKD